MALVQMAPTDRDELNRLHLGIARALERRASLRVLIADVDADIAGRRIELRSATARVARASAAAGVPTSRKAPPQGSAT